MELIHRLRVSYNVITLGFQPNDTGSITVPPSTVPVPALLAAHVVTIVVCRCGDARREATFFTVHQKQADAANTRAVYSGAGTRGETLLSLLSSKNKRRYSEYTRRVFGCGDARREATLFTVHQKQKMMREIQT